MGFEVVGTEVDWEVVGYEVVGWEVVGWEVVGWEVVGWEVVEQREAVEQDVPDQSHTKNLLLYYFPSHFLLIITDALYASLFVIVYSYAYTIQSLNTALLSCLLQTLGIVIHLYTQYT